LTTALSDCVNEHSTKVIVIFGTECARVLLDAQKQAIAIHETHYHYGEGNHSLLLTHALETLLLQPEAKAETWRDLLRARQIVGN
ncbi:MAG: hypothetical protein ACR2QW_17250, partial [bacterium]